MSIAQTQPARYAFAAKAPDDTPNALRYEPIAEGIPAAAASEPWDADMRAEWLDAEVTDSRRESYAGGW